MQSGFRSTGRMDNPVHSARRLPNVHKCVTLRCLIILVQLNKCVFVFQEGNSGNGRLSASILFKYKYMWHYFFFWVGLRYTGLPLGVLFPNNVRCCFRMMYVEWYGVSYCVVGCWDMCWLWWCVCVSSLFLLVRCLWCYGALLWCGGVVIFVLFVMRVDGGVLL